MLGTLRSRYSSDGEFEPGAVDKDGHPRKPQRERRGEGESDLCQWPRFKGFGARFAADGGKGDKRVYARRASPRHGHPQLKKYKHWVGNCGGASVTSEIPLH